MSDVANVKQFRREALTCPHDLLLAESCRVMSELDVCRRGRNTSHERMNIIARHQRIIPIWMFVRFQCSGFENVTQLSLPPVATLIDH